MEVGLGLAELVVAAVIRVSAGVCGGHGVADWCGTATAHGQVQQTGAGGQVDVLNVFHLRATHRTRLQRQTHTHISIRAKHTHEQIIYLIINQLGEAVLLWTLETQQQPFYSSYTTATRTTYHKLTPFPEVLMKCRTFFALNTTEIKLHGTLLPLSNQCCSEWPVECLLLQVTMSHCSSHPSSASQSSRTFLMNIHDVP